MTAKLVGIALAAAIALWLCLPMFLKMKVLHPKQGLMWKGLGTTCALALAVAGASLAGGDRWLCVAALALCVAADVLLEIQFFAGMGMFIAGHVCYIAWFLRRAPLGMAQLVIFAALLLCASVLLIRWSKSIGTRMAPFTTYAMILSMMGACGIACVTGGLPGVLTACGAAMFAVSDGMVCKEVLMPVSKMFDRNAMILYYAAQLCFGATALLM